MRNKQTKISLQTSQLCMSTEGRWHTEQAIILSLNNFTLFIGATICTQWEIQALNFRVPISGIFCTVCTKYHTNLWLPYELLVFYCSVSYQKKPRLKRKSWITIYCRIYICAPPFHFFHGILIYRKCNPSNVTSSSSESSYLSHSSLAST